MTEISSRQKKFVERNYQRLSLEELARRTGLAQPALRPVIESCRAQAHLNLGVSYDKKGELDAAIEQYRAVLALDAGNATAHTYLAIAYYKKGNYRMAIEHCDRAAALQGSANELLLRALAPYRNAAP